jgi:hypothetical protein
MKRGIFFSVLFLGVLLSLPFIVGETITGDTVTGEIITGEATTQQINMQIFVQVIDLFLDLTKPFNHTYRYTDDILLNFTIQNYDSVWYNLDNGPNTTLTTWAYFDVTPGTHTLYLFANDSDSSKSDQVTFFVNTSAFIVYFEEFKGSTKGSSTNFDNYTYEELYVLPNVILENYEYGKIQFHTSINLTDDIDVSDEKSYIDNNVEISFNRVEVDSVQLPNLNKSASIWLYNLSFTNPYILRNGATCPTSICTFESYSDGTLKFNVTMFSYYSAKENDSEDDDGQGEDGEGGSGGGGGVSSSVADINITLEEKEPGYFDVSLEELNVKLKKGETKQEIIKIRNSDDRVLEFLIRQERLEDILLIKETTFTLLPGEEKEITLDFVAKESIIPDLYLGKIIIEGEGSSREVFVSVEIESKKALFDVKATIPWRYKNIKAGEEIFSDIELTNLGDVGKVDVVVEYSIRNRDNKILIKEHEELAVETKVEYRKSFIIPTNLESGDYVFYVAVFYEGEVASSSSWFSIRGKRSINWSLASLYAFLLFIVFSIIRLYQLYVKERREERVKKYEEEEEREEKRKELDKKKESNKKPRYIKIKKKPVVKKAVKKKVNRRLTPEGYLDLTKALKDKK